MKREIHMDDFLNEQLPIKKYLIYCDFSTLKCNRQQFQDFLITDYPDIQNINNNIWIMSGSVLFPFNASAETLLEDLKEKGYADKDSIVFIVEAANAYGNFDGNELFFK